MNADTQFSPDLIMFESTYREVFRRLRTSHNPKDLLEVARWGVREMGRAFARTNSSALAAVRCGAGCAYCCHVPVAVQAHEIFLVSEYIKATCPPADLTELVRKTEAHKARVSGIEGAEYTNLVLACSLLKDGKCSIYEARPEVCRAHHANDPKICEASLSDSGLVQSAYIASLRSRMFGVMLGIDQAFAQAGYDGRAYDFCSALHEALTDGQRILDWSAKKKAFSDGSREPPLTPGGTHGEIRPI